MQVSANINAIRNTSISQEVSSNNIANINTDGFKASRVTQSGDKVTISMEARLAAQYKSGLNISNTEPTQDIVQMTVNQSSVQGNIAAINTQNVMLQALLDVKK